jgi:conjugal transfer/entry exclusion protein
MQIRGILLAQQTATATRAEVVVDKEAQEQAAADLFRSGTYTKSSGRKW